MTKTTFLTVLCLSFFTSLAARAEDAMANMFGNTVSVIDPDGVESRFQYSSNGTFKLSVPVAEFKSSGSWSHDAQGRVCRTYYDDIPGVPKPDCDAEPGVPHNVGDSWTSSNRGKTYKVAILPGLQ